MKGRWGRVRPSWDGMSLDDGPCYNPRSSGGFSQQSEADDNAVAVVDAEAITTETQEGRAPPLRRDRVIPLKEYTLPGFNGAPCGELNQTFVNSGYRGDISKFYTLWDNGVQHEKKFTCVFTCPLTGEHFACGHWENDKGVIRCGTTYWYNKKAAKNAAAAKYLDCMSLRRCHEASEEITPARRCLDPPYLEGDGPPLPTLPPNVELPCVANQILATQRFDVKKALVDWYISFWKCVNEIDSISPDVICNIPNKSECYSCWSNMRESTQNGLRFTALFICPLTGEKFLGGKLLNDDDWIEDHMFYDEKRKLLISNIRFGGEEKENDGEDCEEVVNLPRVDLVWYTTKSKAEEAAAGRALDCLRHRSAFYASGEHTLNQNCTDEPYLKDGDPGLWNDIGHAVVAAEDLVYENSKRLKLVYSIFGRVPEHELITTQFNVDDFHSLVRSNDYHDEWRREYRNSR